MPTEMAPVSRVRMIFHACGTKLVVEARAASAPTQVAASSTQYRREGCSTSRPRPGSCAGEAAAPVPRTRYPRNRDLARALCRPSALHAHEEQAAMPEHV